MDILAVKDISDRQLTQQDDITPSWQIFDFNEQIPDVVHDSLLDVQNEKWIYGMILGRKLVYRCFQVSGEQIKELYRYVFFREKLFLENCDHTRRIVSPERVLDDKPKDFLSLESKDYQKEIFETFKIQVDIQNKQTMLRIMPYIRRDQPKMSIAPFLEVYIKTRDNLHRLEGVPNRIVSELYGRKHKPYSAMRLDKDLAVVTGEKKCRYIYLKEQTRVYFDSNRPYYFIQNVATGFWEREEICRQFEYEIDICDRLIDGNIFQSTCAEQYAQYAMTMEYAMGNRMVYGSLLALMGFLSVEQAAKTDSSVYGKLLEEIYSGRIKDGKSSLPEIMGITGPQLKYLRDIRIPCKLQEFTECIRDPEFIRYFPDVKKRLFAASVFLIGRNNYHFNGTLKEDIFLAAKTICSIEKITDNEKRYHLVDEYRDYLLMRRRYLTCTSQINNGDPLMADVEAVGEVPINMKPSSIHDNHDRLGNLLSILTKKKTIENCDEEIINRKTNEAEEIEYTDGNYSIIMPGDSKDIIREGRTLHHCVGHGGYIESMARKECRILFLRDNRKINEPLITIEERKGSIVQCYGFADSYNHDERIRDFITEYAELHNFRIEAVIYSTAFLV